MEEETKFGKDLPSLYKTNYSSCSRPRRANSAIPEHFKDKVIRCVEYPEGVYISKKGEVKPINQAAMRKSLFVCDIESDDDVTEIPRFVKKPKTKVNENCSVCVVCLEDPAVGVFQVCKHQCCCMKCGAKLETCPLCRVKSLFIHNLEVPENVTIYK